MLGGTERDRPPKATAAELIVVGSSRIGKTAPFLGRQVSRDGRANESASLAHEVSPQDPIIPDGLTGAIRCWRA